MATTPVKVWTKLLGTSSYDSATALTTGLDGSIYIGGYTSGALDGQTKSGETDAFLTKYSTDGTKAWTKLLGASGSDIVTSLTTGLDGSIYASGYTDGALDGQTKSGNWDAFLTKYSANGAKAWTKQLGSSGGDLVTSLTTGLDGSIYVSGICWEAFDGQTYSGGLDAFLIKYSADGTKAWTKQLGSSGDDRFRALATGLDGSIYVSGNTSGALDGQTNSGGHGDAFLTKYSADGSKAWTKLLGSSGGESAEALTIGLDGSIYVSGYTEGALDGQTNSGGMDIFLTKYSVNGAKVWTKLLGTSGTDYASALTTGLDGSIYVSGYTDGALDGQANSGGTDVFLTKYNTDGTKVWTKLLGTSSNQLAAALTTGLDGSIYVSGHTDGALDGQANSGGTDAFLTKFQEVVTPDTYALSAGSSSYNEGSTATFTLRTTNLASGTSVPYTLSGVSAADISGGSLSGNAVVNSSGIATISVTLLNDSLTEGAETLTVTARGTSASTVVNDTSKPSYSLQQWPTGTSANEGYSADFAVTTTGVGSGSALNYTISGSVNAADIATGSLTGQVTVGSNGVANISIPIASDKLTEGPETLTVTVQGQSSSITINDTSKTATYSLGASSSSVNEGSSATFTLRTTNLASGTSVPYTLSGISAADVSGGSLSGNAVVNSSGVATISVTLLNDSLTEGTETLTVTAGGATTSTSVNDTSRAPATYSLFTSNSTVNEGSTASFTLTTTNVSAGTEIPYSISIQQAGGVAYSDPSKDIVGGMLSGKVTIDASGRGIINVSLANDNQTEGFENLSISAGGSTSLIRISDTSLTAPTSNITRVNEGQSFTVYLSNSSYFPGALITAKATGTGLASNDLDSLIKYVLIDGNSTATATFSAVEDRQTEGTETVLIQFSNGDHILSAPISIEILDTSKAPATYSLSSSSSSVNEGSSATFTLTTTNLASGTSVPYTLSGISAADVSGGSLSGNAVVNSIGVATISVTLLNDSLTEGAETLIVTAGGATTSTSVNDTSKAPATYALSSSSSSVNEGSSATFTLITTNLASGSSVPYTLSGISSADVSGGSLSGNAVVNSSGIATISVTLLNDSLTEGAETLTVTAGSANASTAINDTSKGAPTYSLSASSASVDEGAIATFNLLTTNVAAGTSINYSIAGVNSTDIIGGFSGTATVGTNGIAAIFVAVAADFLTEGAEALTVIAQGRTASVTINDSSKSPSPTYSLITNYSVATEGTPVTATLSTTNVAAGTTLYYQITGTGITTADLGGLSLTGTGGVNSWGQVSMTIPLASDLATEGEETFYLRYYTDSGRSVAAGDAAAVTIYDTSKGAATYSLSTSSASIDEGSVATFNLLTTNVAVGTSISYSIGGVSTADITGSLTGTATVGANGTATIFVALAADFLTEGVETLTVTAQGKSASMTINDTSKAAVVPAYAMSAASSSVDEGSIAVFTLTTSNVAGGTSIPYTVSGISATDVTGGALSGVAIVNSSGKATISIPIAADFTTEGIEELTLSAQGKSASMFIFDTSKTAVTVRVEAATAASDAITNSPVSQNIDGGAGIDSLVYSSNAAAVVISKSGGNTLVTNTVTGEVDTLINVERLKFADTAIALDTSGVGGQAYRVYKAAFNRSPDLGGLGYWISGMDGGASLKSVAQGFVSSPEFKAVYGASPTNAQIITKFYENVLNRAPEPGGYNYWLGILNSGQGTIADVLAAFSDSPENQSGVIGVIEKGMRYTPYISPTYSLSAASASVDEGTVATFTLKTTNVERGTSIGYTLSGISAADVFGSSLNGNSVVDSSGLATISVALLNDLLTENAETLTVTAGGATASMVVNDTSIKLIGTPIESSTGSDPGGGDPGGVG